MATLDFPNPTDYPVYEEAGIRWTWNSTLNVWSTDVATGGGGGGDGGLTPVIDGEALPDPVNYDEGQLIYFNNTADDGGSELYIRLDDTDGNAIWVDVSLPGGGGLSEPVTFEQLTTHKAGIDVTGGGIDGNASAVFQAVSDGQTTPLTITTNDNIGASFTGPGAFALYGNTYRQTSGHPAYRLLGAQGLSLAQAMSQFLCKNDFSTRCQMQAQISNWLSLLRNLAALLMARSPALALET